MKIRFKPAKRCGQVFYQIKPENKVEKRAKIMALLLEIMDLVTKKN